MSKPTRALLERLDLERLDRDLFRGTSLQDGRPRVFGGQVAAQALTAAVRTVDERSVHSLHSYFLRPGDPKTPIIYEVDRIRDGRTFTTRRVVAIQNGEAIFNMSASFQVEQSGHEHHVPMPDAAPPSSVPSNAERIRAAAQKTDHPIMQFLAGLEHSIVVHDLDAQNPMKPHVRTEPHLVWFKSDGPLPDDPALHRCVLTYASDMTLLGASLARHALTWFDPKLQVASLDHAIWFHSDFRADEWLLYVTESPSTSGARGLNQGRIFTEEGQLVASVMQENLMRVRG
ncbi:MAG TPA: acyl-CoA thioesterase II [Polyangiaceae bacterium]|nr:acyl-CoA thioesterase II [Polyangiaceae bacterium]